MKTPDGLNALVIKAFFYFGIKDRSCGCSYYLFIYFLEAPNKLLPVPRLTSAGDGRLTRFPGRPAARCHSCQPLGAGDRTWQPTPPSRDPVSLLLPAARISPRMAVPWPEVSSVGGSCKGLVGRREIGGRN